MRVRGLPLLPLWIAALWLLSPRSAQAAAPLFFDDVETGTLMPGDSPPGKWSTCFPAPCDQLSATADGAHRGLYGIRFDDPDTGTGHGVVNGLKKSFGDPLAGDLYLRTWVRFHVASSGTYRVTLLTVQNSFDSVIQSIDLQLPDATVVSSGSETIDGQPAYVRDGTSQVLSRDEWHLVEVALLGLGTAQGQRRTWIDRAELPSHEVDWSGGEGWTVAKFVLGELNADRAFVGTLDFDDVVADVSPLPSHLAVLAPGRTVTNGCVPVLVEARDTVSDLATQARSPVAITLRAQGAGNLYASTDCSGTGNGNLLALTLPAGVSAVGASFRPLQRGTVQLSAEAVDLLPGAPAPVVVTGPAAQLAFPNAPVLGHPDECSPPVWLEVEDDAGMAVVDGDARTVAVTAEVPLFSDPGCTTTLSALTLPGDASGAFLYFRGQTAGTFSLSASADGLSSGQQLEEVTAPQAQLTAPDQVAAGEAVSLDGSASTPSKGAQLTGYRWRELDGPTGVQLVDQPTQALVLEVPGDYRFELTVTDSAGLSSAPVVASLHVDGEAPAVPSLGGCSSAGGVPGWLAWLALFTLPVWRSARGARR